MLTLTQIHYNRLVDFLPKMCSENLDEGDLQRRDLAMEEDSGQIQLNLETDVHICSVSLLVFYPFSGQWDRGCYPVNVLDNKTVLCYEYWNNEKGMSCTC